MQDRLLDFDDKVRLTVVKAICDLAKTNPKWVPTDMLRKVADRLRDKKVYNEICLRTCSTCVLLSKYLKLTWLLDGPI